VSRLRGDSKRPFMREPTGELRQDGEVHVKPHALDSTDAEGQHRPLVLDPAELAFDSSTAPVQLPAALGLARDEGVQAVGLDPHACRLALARRTAPLARAPLEVRACEDPHAMPTARRLVLSALGPTRFLERRNGADASVHAPVVDRPNVVALVHDGRLDLEPSRLRRVEQSERKGLLRVLGRFGCPREREVRSRADRCVDLVPVVPALDSRSKPNHGQWGRSPYGKSRWTALLSRRLRAHSSITEGLMVWFHSP
jgi:hypothetical protein